MLSLRKAQPNALDWDALYTDQVGRIYNFFRYRVGDDATAEDLTSIVFEKAWSRCAQFRGTPESFAAWLYKIARNTANDHYRKDRPVLALEAAHQMAAPQNVSLQVEQTEGFTSLVAAINRLPQRQRELLALKYGAVLNNRQIARQLHLSESNVGTLLNRTLQKLRLELEVQNER